MNLLARILQIASRREARPDLRRLQADCDQCLRQRDGLLAEHDALLRERDAAVDQRSEVLRQRDIAIGERNEIVRQLDIAIGERNEIVRQRDVAIGERNEIVRQRDVAIGESNLSTERLARHVHRADMTARRGAVALQSGRPNPVLFPRAASRDRILLFVHLAKTGGMTLADILVRNFSTGDYLVLDQAHTEASVLGTWSHLDVERGLARMQPAEIDCIRVAWGHFRHGVHEALPKPCAYVTVLRDPVDRIVSAYYYAARDGRDPGATLDEYASRKRHYDLGLDNYMTRVLSGSLALDPVRAGSTTENCPRPTDADFELAAGNLDGYLLVGLTDRFDEALVVLGADLCWSLCDLVHARVNVTSRRPTVADVPESVRDRILDWNRYDAALVERARAHLGRRIDAYPGDFRKDLALFRELNARFRQGAPAEELRCTERRGLR